MLKEDWRRTLRGNTLTTDQNHGIVLGRENIVKRAGYRSAQDQIMELMNAGQRLQTAREEKYSKPTGLVPRHYGEIDIVVGTEKEEAIKEDIKTKWAEKQAQEQQKQQANNPTPETPSASEGGGVT